MNQLTFGPAKLEDAIRISVLLKTVYIQTYSVNGITFESANFIEKRFSKKYIEDAIKENPDQLVVAYYEKNPIGVAEILYDSECPIQKIPVPELSKLYVLERFYGNGVGYGLMEKVEQLIKNKGYDQLSFIVYVENDRAISFYERQGYEKIGKVDFPMEENTYDNWVMNKKV